MLLSMAMRHIAVLALTLLAACGSGTPTELQAARAQWAKTRAECATYHYTLAFDSFGGSRTRTSFEYVDDKPTKRMHVRAHRDFSSMMSTVFIIDESWVETGAEIGTHPDVQLPRTMEKLYDDCSRDVLSQDPGKNMITFNAGEQGDLQQCFFVPSNCADDCAMGDSVTGFSCSPLDTTTPRP
jgi:hypothetical protein